MKLKVCGMKYPDNIEKVAALQPDYLGFIFYEKSPRNFDTEIPKIATNIKKVGVFVDASIEFILEKIDRFNFNALQLHGNESPEYCKQLKMELNNHPKPIKIWKVFSIKDEFDFDILRSYERIVDYFLFDTKGKAKGGNGYTFDWSVLNEYNSSTPFILSGGIGLDEIHKVKEILKSDLPIYAIDVNSKFEIQPGQKDIGNIKKFKKLLTTNS